MKKMMSKLISLVLILALMSAMCLGAAAVQNDDAECASYSSSGSKKSSSSTKKTSTSKSKSSSKKSSSSSKKKTSTTKSKSTRKNKR